MSRAAPPAGDGQPTVETVTTPACPGSNELLSDDDPEPTELPTAGEFERMVQTYGREEASRRWMAIFSAFDSSAQT